MQLKGTLIAYCACDILSSKQKGVGSLLWWISSLACHDTPTDPTLITTVTEESHTDAHPFLEVINFVIGLKLTQYSPETIILEFIFDLVNPDEIPDRDLKRSGTFAWDIKEVKYTPDDSSGHL